MTKKLVGQVTPEEKDEIQRLFERRNGLNELAMILTPFLGSFIDNKGKGATMMMLGAIIMIICHSVFAFVLPLYPSKTLALITILVLGVSF